MAVFETPSELLSRLSGTKLETAIFAAMKSDGAGEAPAARLTLARSGLTREASVEDISAIGPWLEAWRGVASRTGADLETTTRNFVLAKRMRTPKAIVFSSLETFLKFLPADLRERTHRLARALSSIAGAHGAQPQSVAAMRSLFRASEEDQGVLLDLMAWWAQQGPEVRAEIALREIPVESLHTKWIETHQELVLSVFRDLGWLLRESGELHERLGLADEDRGEVWIRLNEEDCAASGRRTREGYAPSEFTLCPPGVDRVMIVENKTTYRRLPVAPGMCLVYGSGKAILSYAPQMTWLRDMERITYWGDCDGEGYSILSGLRQVLPQLRSVFMDDESVIDHMAKATKEKPSEAVKGPLPGLLPEESRGHQMLYKRARRLEQEKLYLAVLAEVQVRAFGSNPS